MGHFNESGGERGVEVVFAEGWFVAESEILKKLLGSQFRIMLEGSDEGFYLVAYLVAFGCGCQGFFDRIEDEFDERRGLGGSIRSAKSFVVSSLVIANDTFHGEVGEFRVPAGECQGLPQASDPTVSIGKRVDELDFVMEDGAGDEWMKIGACNARQLPTRSQHSATWLRMRGVMVKGGWRGVGMARCVVYDSSSSSGYGSKGG